MDAAGVGYAARAGIEYLSTALDPTVQVGGIKEPLPTIQEEILADYSAVGRLQSAIESGADIVAINQRKREAMRRSSASWPTMRGACTDGHSKSAVHHLC